MSEEIARANIPPPVPPVDLHPRLPGRALYLDAAILIALSLLLAAHIFYLRSASEDWLVDDALISFRYAENFATGNGLVFNPGEPVEGYTNFLWTILLGLGAAAGFGVFSLSLMLGTAASVATLIGSYLLFSAATGGRRTVFRFAAPFALALSMPFVIWGFGGLETPLFSALFVFALYFYLKNNFAASGAMFGLLALTRPEGVALFIAAAIYHFASRRGLSIELLRMTILFAIFAVPHEIFRIIYYGDVVPNTFHAKVGTGFEQIPRGLSYIGRFGIQHAALLLAIPFFSVLIYSDKRPRFMIITAAVSLILVAYTGGDPLPAFRFMVPFLALFLVLTAIALDRGAEERAKLPESSPRITRFSAVVFMMFIAGIGTAQTFTGSVHDHVFGDKIAHDGEFVGKWLKANSRPGDTVACNSAGGIPYYSGLKAIDMLGLNDRHIAATIPPGFGSGFAGHEKYDSDYVLARLPEFVVFGSASYTNVIFPGDKIMERHYIFRRMYGRRIVQPDESGADRPFTVWERSISSRHDSYKLLFALAKERGDLRLMRFAADFASNEFPEDAEITGLAESVAKWKSAGRKFDFETGDYSGWKVEGTAFGDAPAFGKIGTQDQALGFEGKYLANSFHGSSDGETGKLIGEEFQIDGNLISFRIGGGCNPSSIALRLVVDGKPVRSETGNNTEILEPRAFDVSEWVGRTAHMEIIDENSGYWGHILVDDIIQHVAPR